MASFPFEGSHTQDFFALKNPSNPAGIEPANLGSRGEYDNHWATGVDENICGHHNHQRVMPKDRSLLQTQEPRLLFCPEDWNFTGCLKKLRLWLKTGILRFLISINRFMIFFHDDINFSNTKNKKNLDLFANYIYLLP